MGSTEGNIRIAFVKFGGLSAGGTERWLQLEAAYLPRSIFDVQYFYCDAAPYIGSDYQHADTDPERLKFMKDHDVNLVRFRVGAKDVTTPTHDWVDTDFWDLFDPCKYDLVITAKAGPAEYPYFLIPLPVLEMVALLEGVDRSPNIAWSIFPSQWARSRWLRMGGRLDRSSVSSICHIPITSGNLRVELGIESTALVAGFHQRVNEHIFSPVPLKAFAATQQPSRHFVIMGGAQAYREQARSLKIANVHFLEHSGDSSRISRFLNTLDIFAHGRSDGETFGTVFAEAMIHSKPCLSHYSENGANAHRSTMGPAGLFAVDVADYVAKLDVLFSRPDLRAKLSLKAKPYAEKHYSLEGAIDHLSGVLQRIVRKSGVSLINRPME
jgi:hypothetical protein